MVSILCSHQIPRDGRQLHSVDAEDEERAPAHPLDGMGDGAVHPALPFQKEPDDAVAHCAIQQDAQRPHRPLTQRNAVGALGQQNARDDAQRGHDKSGSGSAGKGSFEKAALLGQIADVKVGQRHHALCDAERSLPHQRDAPAKQGDADDCGGYVPLGEDLEQHVQKHPRQHQSH